MNGPLITDITRASLHDGPGVRSVAYCKGCPLACLWCHNPETQRAGAEILRRADKCIGCGRCLEVCPACHSLRDGALVYDRQPCHSCGRCADACPGEALTLCGARWAPDTLAAELLKDKAYHVRSGGECLLYPDYVTALLERLRAARVHCVIESALCVPWAHVERVVALTDAFLIDIKHMDPETHRRVTGQSNETILANLARLAAVHPDITIRVPLIPGVNDAFENLLQTAQFAITTGGGIRAMELLRYNPLGQAKYAALGRDATLFEDSPRGGGEMDALCAGLNQHTGRESFVFWTP